MSLSPETKAYFANQAKIEGIYHLSRATRDAYRWTAEEWCRLYDAYKASGWDITPDEWTEWQVRDALWFGIAPDWDENGEPIAPIKTRA
jgi:hypothetical protein